MNPFENDALRACFAEHGTAFDVEGNKPLLIDNAEYVWYVDTGHADVFSIRLENGEVSDRRSYLFRVVSGQVVFGFPDKEEASSLRLLLTAFTGTRVLRVPRTVLSDFAAKPGNMTAAANAAGEWISHWYAVMQKEELADAGHWMREYPFWEGVDAFHRTMSVFMRNRREQNRQAELEQLRKRRENDRLFMSQAIHRLVSVTRETR